MIDFLEWTDEQIEERFLEALGKAGTDIAPLVDALKKLGGSGRVKQADDCAAMLQDVLAESDDKELLLDVLAMRASWKGADQAFKKQCAKVLREVYDKDRLVRMFIENSGFDQDLPAAECLRRFSVLQGLQPGAVCYENTWGVGVVVEVDTFDKQIIIDFEKKTGHRMAFSYAGESVRILSPDSIMYMKHQNRSALDEMVASNPGEVVKMLLREFGPMPAPVIQEKLLDGIVGEKDWKRFWDNARKTLKADPMVDVPAKRNSPVSLLDREKEFDDAWFASFAEERDFHEIMERLNELEKEGGLSGLEDKRAQIIADRLSFIIAGATWRTNVVVEALVFSEKHGFEDVRPAVEAFVASVMNEKAFVSAVSELSAKLLRGLVRAMEKQEPEKTRELLLNTLPLLTLTAMMEALDILLKTAGEQRVVSRIRELLTEGVDSCGAIVCWLAKNMDYAVEKGIGTHETIMNDIVSALSVRDVAGEELKIRNQLKSFFEKDEWLRSAFEKMSGLGRRDVVGRIKNSPAWDHVDRGAVLVNIVRLFPEVESALAEKQSQAKEAGRYTSIRSYTERQNQLRKIVEEDIPANSRDIGIAISHGDLRENADYKAAKEQQSILMRRQADLERMLQQVMQTNFREFTYETAACGTAVVLKRKDGRQDIFNILGEWDNNEERNVISSQSALAKALIGKRAGQAVIVPGESGEEECVLEKVDRLPEEILAWAEGS